MVSCLIGHCIEIRYHKVNSANVAFLAYKLRCHEKNKRPEQLVLHGSLRAPVAEFTVSSLQSSSNRFCLMMGSRVFGRPLRQEPSLYLN